MCNPSLSHINTPGETLTADRWNASSQAIIYKLNIDLQSLRNLLMIANLQIDNLKADLKEADRAKDELYTRLREYRDSTAQAIKILKGAI